MVGRKMQRMFGLSAVMTVVLSIACLLFSCLPAFTQEAAPNPLRRTVRVGIAETDHTTNSAEARHVAFQKSYIQAVAAYADWNVVHVFAHWGDCLEQLKNGDIDLLLDASKTPERLAYYDYSSESMGTEICYMFGRGDTNLKFNEFSTFNGLKIGFEKGSILLEIFRDFGKSRGFSFTPVPFSNGETMFAALDAGEVDAVVQTSYYFAPPGHVILAKCAPSPVYVVTSKKNPELIVELNEAMAQLFSYNPNFNTDIYRYYFGDTVPQTVGFSAREQAYLASKPTVNVYYETGWKPFEYDEHGRAEGITPDVLRTIGEKTGINFRFLRFPSTNEIFTKITEKSRDSVMAVSTDYLWGRDHNLLVTQPYISGSIMRVMKRVGMDPKTVAVLKGSYLAAQIADKYPDLRPIEYLTPTECMDAVETGRADCTFLNHYQAAHFRTLGSYDTFVYQPIERITQSISLGVTMDSDPALFGILSKVLLNISSDRLQNILNDDAIPAEPLTFHALFRHYPAQVLAALAVLCILFGILIFLLATSSARRRKNEQLLAAKQEADKANAAKSEFLSRISHDMRTPLNGILGMTYIANEQDNNPKTRDCLAKIDVSSKLLLTLINDVLDMARVESGHMELHPEPYTVEELNSYLDAVIRPLCAGRNQTFLLEEDIVIDTLPLADKNAINQILFNLLSNAVKFTPEGGTITYKIHGEQIAEHRVAIEHRISDTGIGMSRAFQARLFTPFTQESRNDNSEMRGSGLGLAIVKKLVDLLGGTIDVESEQGKGTTFTLRFEFDSVPARIIPSPAVGTEQQDDSACLEGKHVLLCEDHPLNQEIAKTLLTRKKLIVDVAENGQVGVEKVRHSIPGFYDLVLMDIRMPVMNGYEAAQAIRNLERDDAKKLPIIAMTADAFAGDVQKCLDAGMNGHIAKPIDPKILYHTLVSTIRHYGASAPETRC